ncbi:transposase [Flavisolibacter sp. BT320]|nr:transposase [Flavisolibacter longurius]
MGKKKIHSASLRWIVEGTFGWRVNYRKLVKDYEKTVIMSRVMLEMTAIHITLNN